MKNGSVFKWIVGLVFFLPVIALRVFVWVERDYIFGTTGIADNGYKFGVKVGSQISTTSETLMDARFE